MAEDETDPGIAPHDPVADEQIGGPGGVKEKVNGKRDDTLGSGPRELTWVDKDDGVTCVERRKQRLLLGRAQVDAAGVGSQDDALGRELVEGALGLDRGRRDIWQRHGGVEAEAPRTL